MELLTPILKLILTNYSLGYGAPNSYFGSDNNQPFYSLVYGAPYYNYFKADTNQLFSRFWSFQLLF